MDVVLLRYSPSLIRPLSFQWSNFESPVTRQGPTPCPSTYVKFVRRFGPSRFQILGDGTWGKPGSWRSNPGSGGVILNRFFRFFREATSQISAENDLFFQILPPFFEKTGRIMHALIMHHASQVRLTEGSE